jgi:AsmA protein
MKFKKTSPVLEAPPPQSQCGPKTERTEKERISGRSRAETLKESYKPWAQKLDMANMPGKMKRKLKITAIVFGALLAIVLVLPLLINVNSFRPKIESEAGTALGRQVTLGDLSLSILTGEVGVENIQIADDPAFGKSPFVTAKSVKVGVKLFPLIFSKQLVVTGIILEEPQITLLKAPNGKWNFSSLGGSAKESAKPEKSSTALPQNFSIGKLEIRDGKMSVGNVNSKTTPQLYDKVNLEVTDFSLTSQFPFELTALLPGGGKTTVSGKAGPINQQDAANTPMEVGVKVNDLNLATSGFVEPSSGIGGQVDMDGTLKSDGSQAKLVGALTCNKLKLSPKGTPAAKPVAVKYALNSDLSKQSGTITQGDIAIGKAHAQLSGGFRTQGESQIVNLKLSAPNMPVDELAAMLPALGVTLPSGSQLTGGTLSADLGITGPISNPVITGPVRLANTKLAGFDLGSKLGALSTFTGKAGSSRDTSIQNASLNARIAPDGTKADAINVIVPALGVVTGAGTISPGGALDFRMVADLQGGMAGGLTQRGGKATANGIPFSIQGTASDPKFLPDVKGMAGSAATGALQNAVSGKSGGAGGLLKLRKP